MRTLRYASSVQFVLNDKPTVYTPQVEPLECVNVSSVESPVTVEGNCVKADGVIYKVEGERVLQYFNSSEVCLPPGTYKVQVCRNGLLFSPVTVEVRDEEVAKVKVRISCYVCTITLFSTGRVEQTCVYTPCEEHIGKSVYEVENGNVSDFLAVFPDGKTSSENVINEKVPVEVHLTVTGEYEAVVMGTEKARQTVKKSVTLRKDPEYNVSLSGDTLVVKYCDCKLKGGCTLRLVFSSPLGEKEVIIPASELKTEYNIIQLYKEKVGEGGYLYRVKAELYGGGELLSSSAFDAPVSEEAYSLQDGTLRSLYPVKYEVEKCVYTFCKKYTGYSAGSVAIPKDGFDQFVDVIEERYTVLLPDKSTKTFTFRKDGLVKVEGFKLLDIDGTEIDYKNGKCKCFAYYTKQLVALIESGWVAVDTEFGTFLVANVEKPLELQVGDQKVNVIPAGPFLVSPSFTLAFPSTNGKREEYTVELEDPLTTIEAFYEPPYLLLKLRDAPNGRVVLKEENSRKEYTFETQRGEFETKVNVGYLKTASFSLELWSGEKWITTRILKVECKSPCLSCGYTVTLDTSCVFEKFVRLYWNDELNLVCEVLPDSPTYVVCNGETVYPGSSVVLGRVARVVFTEPAKREVQVELPKTEVELTEGGIVVKKKGLVGATVSVVPLKSYAGTCSPMTLSVTEDLSVCELLRPLVENGCYPEVVEVTAGNTNRVYKVDLKVTKSGAEYCGEKLPVYAVCEKEIPIEDAVKECKLCKVYVKLGESVLFVGEPVLRLTKEGNSVKLVVDPFYFDEWNVEVNKYIPADVGFKKESLDSFVAREKTVKVYECEDCVMVEAVVKCKSNSLNSVLPLLGFRKVEFEEYDDRVVVKIWVSTLERLHLTLIGVGKNRYILKEAELSGTVYKEYIVLKEEFSKTYGEQLHEVVVFLGNEVYTHECSKNNSIIPSIFKLL